MKFQGPPTPFSLPCPTDLCHLPWTADKACPAWLYTRYLLATSGFLPVATHTTHQIIQSILVMLEKFFETIPKPYKEATLDLESLREGSLLHYKAWGCMGPSQE